MNFFFITALQLAVGCDAAPTKDLALPDSIRTQQDAQQLIYELSGALFADGKLTVDAKNVMLQGTGGSVGTFTVGINMATRQVDLSCGPDARQQSVSQKRHNRGRRFANSSSIVKVCRETVSSHIANLLSKV